jgi:uncharacterized LabA/DUF88 family protein
MRKTIVYVDGFNLYYILKKQNAKWLDLGALCDRLLTENDIVTIKYFTARVKSRVGDLDVHVRQNVYLEALKTNPKIEVIFGHFLTNNVWMVKTSDEGKPLDEIKKVQVIKTEEKGSDVNIATHLLVDGFQNKYDAAAVITNDSDLKLPIEMVKTVLKKTVGVICPQERPSKELLRAASFFKVIKPATYLECQLSDKVHGNARIIHKPKAWS